MALVVLVLMFVGCYALPPFLPWSYTDLDFLSLQQPPSGSHWFGTNALGQDLLAQTLRGMQKSLLIGVCVAFISTIIAATVGAIAGYFGGWRDRASMWVVDLLLVVPSFILIAIVTPRLGQSGRVLSLILLLAAFSWMISARIVRGMTMSLREREFVTAARYMGVSNWRIIVRHVLPNVASILIIDTTLNVGRRDPGRDRVVVPRIRHPAARRVAGHADRRRHPLGDDVPVGVPVPCRHLGADRVVRQRDRRRPARRDRSRRQPPGEGGET